ncbi:hypothetical protein FisN_3Lh052 [Fistulifera solaris]|uniref:Uncharacterized protein n=1 Tax=Fistulifera solaris TaxID=1519565 RepID=A0A1Z5JYN1_FISSO|nr:hypothetical protein FisN_3Lh052 [Fistulifera solaris]|eukprot:GAX19114.1 hypothetical protein FisN_3Lh052 [Fistulifera solaris]
MMRLEKITLSLLSLIALTSVKLVHGDGFTDESCPDELATYEACAINNMAACKGECEHEPEFTEEVFVALMTDPSFMCEWLNEAYCAVHHCCNICLKEATAYLDCQAKELAENGTCNFSCDDDNGDAGNDAKDNGGTTDNNDGNGGAGVGQSSSGSLCLATLTIWTSAIIFVGYTLS